LSGAKYGYGISTPAGADRSGARVISNLLGNQAGASKADERGLWTALYEFGQFFDHEFGLAKGGLDRSL